jgi:thioester reductase-like protein
MSRYQLWDESFAHRIFPVLGDLSQPQLGLEDLVFARLAEKIDIIYHCGAWVNIIYPLSVLKATNVNSTEEILRLASRTKVKPVHYISTIDVFSSLNDPDEGGICAISRDCIAGPLNHLYSGYAQSKLLAEKLLQTASERGVPVSIYRPSNIIGHHRSGIWDPKSFIAMFIKGCLQMGLAPQVDAQLNLVTMDYVGKAILNLAQTQIPQGKFYLMVNPHPLPWGTLLKWIAETGYPLTLVPYEAWYSQLLKISTTPSTNILSPLVSYLANPGFVQKLLGTFTFDCQDTTEILAQQSLYCPVIDQQFMTAYFTYFVETGYWSVPPAATLTPPLRIANSTH